MELKNKRIVITGATSGIGLGLLKSLVEIEGIRIVAAGRKTENLPAGENIFPFKCDVSEQAEVDNLFRFAGEKMGGIDIFVANAGYAHYEKLETPDWERMEKIYATNVFSPVYSLTKMIELNKTNECLVLITASAIAKVPVPGYSLYSATKASLDGFNTAMQYEMPSNVHLSMLYPVATYTKFFERADQKAVVPWPRQQPEAVVKAILKGIKRNKKRIYPFPFFRITMYFVNLLPFTRIIYLKWSQSGLEKWYNSTTAEEKI
jgi:Short-chain dehydrogenases of various substrate specificities